MFSERLKLLRKRKNVTQTKFAEDFNISNGTIGNWETGNRQPDIETLGRIANYFNVSIDYLIGRTDFTDEENIIICHNVNHILGSRKNAFKSKDADSNYIRGEMLFNIRRGLHKFTYDSLNDMAKSLETTPETLMYSNNNHTLKDFNIEASTNTYKEFLLLNHFRQLNDEGQDYILNTIDLATCKYGIDSESSISIAAAPEVTPAKVDIDANEVKHS